tara:strand:+ start:13 stop:153 length:141 start_codon:yes stop_codon:yes gene_type:complete
MQIKNFKESTAQEGTFSILPPTIKLSTEKKLPAGRKHIINDMQLVK